MTTKIQIEVTGDGALGCPFGDEPYQVGTREITDDFDYSQPGMACANAFESALAFESPFHYAACYGDVGIGGETGASNGCTDLLSLAETCITLEHSANAEHDDARWLADLVVLNWRETTHPTVADFF